MSWGKRGPGNSISTRRVVTPVGPITPYRMYGVHHAVAVEPVVAAVWRKLRVGSIAEVHAVEVVGQVADHVEAVLGALLGDRRVEAGEVRIARHLPGVRR